MQNGNSMHKSLFFTLRHSVHLQDPNTTGRSTVAAVVVASGVAVAVGAGACVVAVMCSAGRGCPAHSAVGESYSRVLCTHSGACPFWSSA